MKKILLLLIISPVLYYGQGCWEKLFIGQKHIFGINKSGALFAWGSNDYGELGKNGPSTKDPILIGSANDWLQILPGRNNSFGIKKDSTLWTWGENSAGQLGNGTLKNVLSPTQIGVDKNWKQISTTGLSVHAIKNDGTLWAWGYNFGSLLGTELLDDYILTPTQIGKEKNWKNVIAKSGHTFAIKEDGSLWGCGHNFWGQLGDSTFEDRRKFTKIGLSNDWNQIEIYGNFTLGIKNDGSLWAWGDNSDGQLGLGYSGGRINTPIKIDKDNNWSQVATGGMHSIGIKKDGSLWAWGNNGYSQLGLGHKFNTSYITPMSFETDWLKVFAIINRTYALKKDGSLYYTGENLVYLGCGTPNVSTLTKIECPSFENIFEIKINSTHNNLDLLSGEGFYNKGDTCTLKAISNASYTFNNWTHPNKKAILSLDYRFVVDSNYTFLANYTRLNSSIKDNFNSGLTIFPNPSNGVFELNKEVENTDIFEIEIYNNIGRKIHKSSFQNLNSKIDFSDKPNGIYLLKAKTRFSEIIYKLVLEK